MNRLLPLGLAVLALAGCANDPAPREQMRLTTQAVEQARAVGADAQIEEMQLAEKKLARAEKNMGEEDYKRAVYVIGEKQRVLDVCDALERGDFETVGDENTPADSCVTIRERDSMSQVRIPIAEVKNYISERVKI